MALVERNVLIETNMQVNPGSKKWVWMGKPGEVLWNEETDSVMLVQPSAPFASGGEASAIKNLPPATASASIPLRPVPEPDRTPAKPDENAALNALLGVAA